MRESIVLRKVAGVFAACRRGFGMRLIQTAPNGVSLSTLAFAVCLMLTPVILALLLAFVLPHGLLGVSLATAAPAITRDLRTLINEITQIENEYKGKVMPQNIGEHLDGMYAEAKAIQDESDRKKKRAALDAFSREVPNPTLPGVGQVRDRKGAPAGYVALGEYFTASNAYLEAKAAHFPKQYVTVQVPGLLGIGRTSASGYIPLTDVERKAFESTLETKDLAVFGTRVIEPQRLPDIVRDTENDQLNLRDVLNVSPTSSDLVTYVARKSYTRGAAIQSEGSTAATTGTKGESDAEYELRESPVRTVATTMPVSEQQLADAPALINSIQTDLLWDVRKTEEEQVVWGDGTGLNLDGLEDNISAGRSESGDTFIDKVRRGTTDVRTSGYQPSALAIHPIDWEVIELEKGSDGHYIWAIIRDALGPRIWSLRVVETIAMENPDTGERIMIPGDWRRGATLFDRQQANIAIGWIDDQFVKNLRTIRAEERVAFALRAPAAFRKYQTDPGGG